MVEVVVNGRALQVPAGASVADVLARWNPQLAAGRGVAVALHEAVVPVGAWASTAVAAGDRLEVVQAVAGG